MSVPEQSPGRLLTVGHSTHDPQQFCDLLAAHGVQALCDVRSRPYSAYSPQFNADRMPKLLLSRQIRYVPMGDQLEGQPADETLWRDGRPAFALMAASEPVKIGITRIQAGLSRPMTLALMCSEEDPAICHRHRLLWPLVKAEGIELDHIRGDGRLEDPVTTSGRVAPVQRRQWQQPLFGG